MNKNSTNPAQAHMDVAQDQIATYAMLLGKAQSSLTASMQAFERANENSLTGDCPKRKQITQRLRQQYKALTNLTDAIVGTLDAPTLSRFIATAPQQSPKLATLLNCLPEEERKLLTIALNSLLQAEGEDVLVSKEQVDLAASILYAAGE